MIFALVYVAWRQWRQDKSVSLKDVPSSTALAVAAVVVGAVSFFVRLAIPVGSTIAWLQLAYFPAYVLLFIVGCMAARMQVLERVTFTNAKPWGLVSLAMLILLPIMLLTRGADGPFTGGWTLNAAFYALWDPLAAWGIILLLLWSFRVLWSKGNRFTSETARRAYGAYIVHPPVLVGLSLLCRAWTAPPLLKFAVVGLAASVAAFGAASVLLLIPGAKKVL